jgi:hypothetical protein
VRRDEAAQRFVREIATLLRLAADDLDKLAEELPLLSEAEVFRRVEESTGMTRAAIQSMTAEGE